MSGKYPYLVINRDTKGIVHRRDLQSTESYSYLNLLKSVHVYKRNCGRNMNFYDFVTNIDYYDVF